MRILLLETDRLLANNLVSAFGQQGHDIDWQVDPQEALISIDVQPVDLIIMDLVLAGRSGVEFLYEIRSYPDWVDKPVITYSSVPARELAECGTALDQLNIKQYLFKSSTSINRLLEVAERYLSVPA